MLPIDAFWRGQERPNEKQYENVSTTAQVVFCWILKNKRRDDLKRLARTCRLNAHIVKKFRWIFDKWQIHSEKYNLIRSHEPRKMERYKDLQEKRYVAYDQLIRLVEDPKHYKYNSKWSHYVNKNTIVNGWTVEQCLFTFSGECGRIRRKWKDRGLVEHLHFYQYYRERLQRDIHYYRSGKSIRFTIHETGTSVSKKKREQIDWPEHVDSDDSDHQGLNLEC